MPETIAVVVRTSLTQPHFGVQFCNGNQSQRGSGFTLELEAKSRAELSNYFDGTLSGLEMDVREERNPKGPTFTVTAGLFVPNIAISIELNSRTYSQFCTFGQKTNWKNLGVSLCVSGLTAAAIKSELQRDPENGILDLPILNWNMYSLIDP